MIRHTRTSLNSTSSFLIRTDCCRYSPRSTSSSRCSWLWTRRVPSEKLIGISAPTWSFLTRYGTPSSALNKLTYTHCKNILKFKCALSKKSKPVLYNLKKKNPFCLLMWPDFANPGMHSRSLWLKNIISSQIMREESSHGSMLGLSRGSFLSWDPRAILPRGSSFKPPACDVSFSPDQQRSKI